MNPAVLLSYIPKLPLYHLEAFANLKSPDDLFEHKLKGYDNKFVFFVICIWAIFVEILFQIIIPQFKMILGLKYLPCIAIAYFLLWLLSFTAERNREKQKLLRGYSIWGTLVLPALSLIQIFEFVLGNTISELLRLALIVLGLHLLHKYFRFKVFKGKRGIAIVILLAFFSIFNIVQNKIFGPISAHVNEFKEKTTKASEYVNALEKELKKLEEKEH
jgi:hypothetical protein